VNQTLTWTNSPAVADTSNVAGFVGSDLATVTSATYTYSGVSPTTYGPSPTPPTNVGTYSVTPSAAVLNFTSGSAADYNTPNTYVAGTLTITIDAHEVASNNAGSGTSISNSTSFNVASGTPALVLVSYNDKNGNRNTNLCNSTLTGSALSAGSLLAPSNYAPYFTTGSGSNTIFYQMCVYQAIGTGTTGNVTVGFSGSTTHASIQVVEFLGDPSAGFALAAASKGNDSTPVFALSPTVAGNASEVLFGDTYAGSNTWPTTEGGFANLFTPTPVSTFTPAAYFGSPALASISGTLSGNTHWGTIGIEVTP